MSKHINNGKHILKAVMSVGLLMLISCNDSAVPQQPADNWVTFGIADYDGWNEITRGSELTYNLLKETGLGVFAYHTGSTPWEDYIASSSPNFMNNTKVAYNTETEDWEYFPLRYWNSTGDSKISFFAYAPYNETQRLEGSKMTFTQPSEFDEQVDMCWSTTDNRDLERETSSGQDVQLHFHHALSRIGFTITVKGEDNAPLPEGVTMTIQEVAVKGFGTGALDLAVFSQPAQWSAYDNMTEFPLNASEHFVEGNYVLTKDNTGSQPLSKPGTFLMVIPKSYSADEPYQIIVRYKVELEDQDGREYIEYRDESAGVIPIDLVSGKTYIFNIITNLKKSVIGDVSITDWKENSEYVVIQGIVPETVK